MNTSASQKQTKADLIIHAGLVLPHANSAVLRDHAIVIQNGKISNIISSDSVEADSAYSELHYPNQLLMPGLINSHTHTPMTLLKGFADDLPLNVWLEQHIWPIEGAMMSEEFVRDGCNLAIAEMLRSGTTCFSDMYFYPNVIAECARQAGIRATIGLPILEFPSAWADDADNYINKGLMLADELQHEPLLQTVLAPHSVYTVAPPTLKRVATLSDELDKKVHIHLQENASEVANCIAEHGHRPMQVLKDAGLVNPHLIAVHMTEVNDDELTNLAKRNASVVHCPESNHKLASGVCPTQKMAELGINVSLGTDGSASNNDLNMFGEMRSAAFAAKTQQADASAGTAQQVLNMATRNGAQTLGLQESCGQLKKGLSADIISIDVNSIEATPLHNPVSFLAYAAAGDAVQNVWVAGKQLLRERKLLTLDEAELIERGKHWADKIAQHQSQQENV